MLTNLLLHCPKYVLFRYRFLRGIAYGEFTRLIHGYLGGRRIPLPACSYHSIRKTFPEKSAYAGFETEDADWWTVYDNNCVSQIKLEHCRAKWCPFSLPEVALFLVSTKNRDLRPGPTPEVLDSRKSRHSAHAQSQVWLFLVSILCYWTWPEVMIPGGDQMEHGLWGREWVMSGKFFNRLWLGVISISAPSPPLYDVGINAENAVNKRISFYSTIVQSTILEFCSA